MTNKIALSPREDRVIRYLKNKALYLHNQYYMQKYGNEKGITVAECTNVLGTVELRKIISDLRKKGFVVKDIWETGENRFGEPGRWKRYFITGRKWDKFDKMIRCILKQTKGKNRK